MKAASVFIQSIKAIVWKDLAAEWRSRELISGMLIFAILILIIFNFALELEAHTSAGISSGILWVTLVFSGTTALNHSLAAEKDRGCLDGLLLAPVDHSVVFFGKVLANWFFMLLAAGFLLPVYSMLYSVNLLNSGLMLVVVLGTAGYSLAGTLLAAMSVQTRTRDMLLPIILFPIVVPLLLACVKASSAYLQGFPAADIQPWLTLLVVFDLVFAALGLLLFDTLMEE